jgi:hypothetical protein
MDGVGAVGQGRPAQREAAIQNDPETDDGRQELPYRIEGPLGNASPPPASMSWEIIVVRGLGCFGQDLTTESSECTEVVVSAFPVLPVVNYGSIGSSTLGGSVKLIHSVAVGF